MHTQNVSLSRQLRNSTLPSQKETYVIVLMFTDIECFDTDFNILCLSNGLHFCSGKDCI